MKIIVMVTALILPSLSSALIIDEPIELEISKDDRWVPSKVPKYWVVDQYTFEQEWHDLPQIEQMKPAESVPLPGAMWLFLSSVSILAISKKV